MVDSKNVSTLSLTVLHSLMGAARVLVRAFGATEHTSLGFVSRQERIYDFLEPHVDRITAQAYSAASAALRYDEALADHLVEDLGEVVPRDAGPFRQFRRAKGSVGVPAPEKHGCS